MDCDLFEDQDCGKSRSAVFFKAQAKT